MMFNVGELVETHVAGLYLWSTPDYGMKNIATLRKGTIACVLSIETNRDDINTRIMTVNGLIGFVSDYNLKKL